MKPITLAQAINLIGDYLLSKTNERILFIADTQSDLDALKATFKGEHFRLISGIFWDVEVDLVISFIEDNLAKEELLNSKFKDNTQLLTIYKEYD